MVQVGGLFAPFAQLATHCPFTKFGFAAGHAVQVGGLDAPFTQGGNVVQVGGLFAPFKQGGNVVQVGGLFAPFVQPPPVDVVFLAEIAILPLTPSKLEWTTPIQSQFPISLASEVL